MQMDTEGRRTIAQFLNSLAVGIVVTLVLAPLANGTFRPGTATGAAVVSAICHLLALRVGRRSG